MGHLIKLSTSIEELNSQFDSLKILEKKFYTKVMFNTRNELDESAMKAYVSDLFNSTEYSSKYIQHYGIYNPIIMGGTKNVVGLNVLLVHTAPAVLISKGRLTNLTNNTNISGLSQDISYGQSEDIANMLSKKYGLPIDTLKSEFLKFYVIEGNQIHNYHSDSLNIGQMILWKTPYLDIKFFKGISSPTNTFNSKEHIYMTFFDNKPFREIDYDGDERPCRSYCYISYELNSKTMERLELDKAKL